MKSLFFTFLIAIQLLATAQQTQLDVKQKGKNIYQVSIFLSDDKGNPGIGPDAFIASDKVYFTIVPNEKSERAYFKESDVEDILGRIKLWQTAEVGTAQPILPIIVEKKITKVILAYSKKNLKLWEDFIFKSEVGVATPIHIEETYFDDYVWFKQNKEKLGQLKAEKNYDEILRLSDEVLDSIVKSPFAVHMHFYDDLTATYPYYAISEQANNFKAEFASVEKQFLAEYNYSDLLTLGEIAEVTKEYFEKADKYTSAGMKQSKASAQLISATIENFENAIEINTEKFKLKNLLMLEKGKYEQYQFRLFVDMIYNKILSNGTFTPVKRHLSFDSTVHKEEKDKLETTGWEQMYSDLLFSLQPDKDQADKNIFNEKIISNLEKQLSTQPKPYYELFKAANSASLGNDDFVETMTQAISKSTDFEEVALMEIMKICYNKTSEELTETVIKNLNAGLKKLKENKWKEADFSFELAIRQQSQFAPAWYYLGLSEYKLGEIFSAQSRIDQSLALDPDYISPRLFTFSLLKEQGDFVKILAIVKDGLRMGEVYLFHFWKAEAHFQLKQYNEAVEEIKNGCIPLNPNQEDAYFLLGDVYAAMKKFDLAKEAYLRTQQINPFESARFNEKMSQLPPSRP